MRNSWDQKTCVERVLDAHQQKPKGGRALIVLPTGGGKTIVFTEIARRLGLKTLIVAHRHELLQQAADKFRLVDPTAIIGQVGAGRHEWSAPITVASIQTISRPEHLQAVKQLGYDLVILDEVHHAASPAYQAVLAALPASFVLGVTATPDRLDGQSIEALLGEPIFSTTIIDLVEQGYLCNLRTIAVRTTTSLDGVHTQAGDFKTDELEEVIDTPVRNERVVNAYVTHCQGRQALCFAVTVAHAQHLTETFCRAGVSAAMLSGDLPTHERQRILQEYERGNLDVVCNCGVLLEGFDAPQTSCVIMARPTQSRALFVQAVGRGTCLAPGKEDCIIVDVTDNCLKHRLQPMTLGKALGLAMEDGQSITQAREREERDKQERTTRVTMRTHDLVVNVLARLDWKRRGSGGYVLEIGERKHTILLIPSRDTDGYYSVWAELAPDYQRQQWLKDAPLDWAQQHAEMKARLLQADENKRILVDSTAAWIAHSASIKQIYLLRKLGIPFAADITRGEASDLIGKAKEDKARQQAEKAAAKKRLGKGKQQRAKESA